MRCSDCDAAIPEGRHCCVWYDIPVRVRFVCETCIANYDDPSPIADIEELIKLANEAFAAGKTEVGEELIRQAKEMAADIDPDIEIPTIQ